LSRGDDTYFTMNLQNHRQCPAGGFSFSGRSAMLRSLAGEGIRTGLLTGSGHPSLRQYFSFSPSSSRPPNVLRCKMPLGLRFLAPAGCLASISLRHRLFIFLSGTKALLLKGRWLSPEAEFAAWRPKTSNWRSEPLERGGILPFRSALRLARDTEARASCVSVWSP
jgi:hypothetical protein